MRRGYAGATRGYRGGEIESPVLALACAKSRRGIAPVVPEVVRQSAFVPRQSMWPRHLTGRLLARQSSNQNQTSAPRRDVTQSGRHPPPSSAVLSAGAPCSLRRVPFALLLISSSGSFPCLLFSSRQPHFIPSLLLSSHLLHFFHPSLSRCYHALFHGHIMKHADCMILRTDVLPPQTLI